MSEVGRGKTGARGVSHELKIREMSAVTRPKCLGEQASYAMGTLCIGGRPLSATTYLYPRMWVRIRVHGANSEVFTQVQLVRH